MKPWKAFQFGNCFVCLTDSLTKGVEQE